MRGRAAETSPCAGPPPVAAPCGRTDGVGRCGGAGPCAAGTAAWAGALLIVEVTSFLTQGQDSVDVARQYCAQVGKQDNRQSGGQPLGGQRPRQSAGLATLRHFMTCLMHHQLTSQADRQAQDPSHCGSGPLPPAGLIVIISTNPASRSR